ncbi:MAG: hypothetical protein IPJ06_11790 [Saprospiraceae bacterium]|nr:hypothetical protein [Saprospiraceae bacterium]
MRFLFLLVILTTPFLLSGQNANDAKQSVIIQADIQTDPPAITLKWKEDLQNSGYTIYRKLKDNQSGQSERKCHVLRNLLDGYDSGCWPGV